MKIYKLAQSIGEDTIKWWSTYAGNTLFNSEQEAREWVRTRVMWINERNKGMFEIDEQADENLIQNIPVYKINATKWKIGRRLTNRPQYAYNTNRDLISFQVQNYATTMGSEFGKKFSKCVYIDNKKIRPFDRIYEDNLQKIIGVLKDGADLPPILLDGFYGVLDGNHRHKAAEALKIKSVPVVFYYDPKEGVPLEIE